MIFLLLRVASASGLLESPLVKMSLSAPPSRLPTATLSSSICGATSLCSRFSSYIAASSPIVTTTKVWYCGDQSGTARPLICGLQQPQPDQIAKLQPLHHRRAHCHRARTDAVFLVARQVHKLTHPGQGVGQTRHRRSRQPAATGDLQIAKPRFMTLETAQDIECPRHHLNDIALARAIAGEHSPPTQPLRAPPHPMAPIPGDGIKFHLQNKLPQAICRHNRKPKGACPS